MTIDERLDALTQSVELIATMQQRTERELRILARLARRILTDHEQRIDSLEN